MLRLPSLLLRQLYTLGSLANIDGGFHFSIKNRLADAVLTRIHGVRLDGRELPLEDLELDLGDGQLRRVTDVTPDRPIQFPMREVARIRAEHEPLGDGEHEIELEIEAAPFGRLEVRARDAVAKGVRPASHIPFAHDDQSNYSAEMIAQRRALIERRTGASLQHVSRMSWDPHLAKGHAENFVGTAQVPLGFAGPLRINGEHAHGEFLVPLATTEGTLVASYSRGMKVLTLAGGVTTTVSDDAMQRAPVFVFESARQARDFTRWVTSNFEEIRAQAEATSRVARLRNIEPYLASRLAFLRFNFTTGDAAGQNMVTRATFAAAAWIAEHAPDVVRWYLESNFATDKKPSHVIMLHTRGKRVTAEAVIPAALLREHLRTDPATMHFHGQVANVGSMMAGVMNNGLHSANGITAVFIATGQDVANVAESCMGIVHHELTPAGDLYLSITIPSLIVATRGGGTGLPTQRECLESLGCYGDGKVYRLAEVVAATVLAGELSLASAISSQEWVSAHERLGRHR